MSCGHYIIQQGDVITDMYRNARLATTANSRMRDGWSSLRRPMVAPRHCRRRRRPLRLRLRRLIDDHRTVKAAIIAYSNGGGGVLSLCMGWFLDSWKLRIEKFWLFLVEESWKTIFNNNDSVLNRSIPNPTFLGIDHALDSSSPYLIVDVPDVDAVVTRHSTLK